MQMVREEPLGTCPGFTTTDPDEAIEEATKVLAPHQMHLRGDLATFQAHGSWADLDDTSVCFLDYRTPLSFYCEPWDSYVAAIMPISGVMGVSFDGGDVVLVPPGSCAVLPPSQRCELQFSMSFSLLALTAQTSALSAGLRRIAPK